MMGVDGTEVTTVTYNDQAVPVVLDAGSQLGPPQSDMGQPPPPPPQHQPMRVDPRTVDDSEWKRDPIPANETPQEKTRRLARERMRKYRKNNAEKARDQTRKAVARFRLKQKEKQSIQSGGPVQSSQAQAPVPIMTHQPPPHENTEVTDVRVMAVPDDVDDPSTYISVPGGDDPKKKKFTIPK